LAEAQITLFGAALAADGAARVAAHSGGFSRESHWWADYAKQRPTTGVDACARASSLRVGMRVCCVRHLPVREAKGAAPVVQANRIPSAGCAGIAAGTALREYT